MRDVSEQKKKSAPEAKGATAVRKFHTHSIPLDMEDIARDWEKPVVDAGIAAKASVIVRVGSCWTWEPAPAPSACVK